MEWWSREEIQKRRGTDELTAEEYALTLGDEIRRRRVTRGMSQDEFADAVGASRRAVFYWERGERVPSEKYLHEIDRLSAPASHELLLKDAGFSDTLKHLEDLYSRAARVHPDIQVEPGEVSPEHSRDHHVTRGPRVDSSTESGETVSDQAGHDNGPDTPTVV